jgi:hypothetical protein
MIPDPLTTAADMTTWLGPTFVEPHTSTNADDVIHVATLSRVLPPTSSWSVVPTDNGTPPAGPGWTDGPSPSSGPQAPIPEAVDVLTAAFRGL